MAASSTDTPTAEHPKHTNHLISEKSPYLLQHAHSPVEWYPWCAEAIEKAKKENKLIFLSLGYSTCQCCGVIEKISFENEDVAKIRNEHYINIKVDCEERPHIKRVYMLFMKTTYDEGEWPMSLFLTPDLHPLSGGTDFLPEDLLELAEEWEVNKNRFWFYSQDTIERMEILSLDYVFSTNFLGELTWEKCVRRYVTNYEPEFGGFGSAPKFPQPSIFNFLFHYYARDKNNAEGKKCLDMCLHTLTKIAKGGIHDHISSGFARYSVDNDWHVPHFKKTLYDQAQLTIAYKDAFLATKEEFYAEVVRDIIKYVNRDLRHESGGFYSAEDDDSYPEVGAAHKKDGAFYTWEYKELKSLLKDQKINWVSYLEVFCDYFSVKEDGNISPESDNDGELKNQNVLIVYGSKEDTAKKYKLTIEQFNQVISECVEILNNVRQKRPRPLLNTKMLCSWNGLMIAGLAQAGQGLGEKQFVEDAIKTAEFIQKHLYDDSTKILLHSCYRAEDGSITQLVEPIKGFLSDYAFLIKGLLDLYEASLDCQWLKWARDLQHKQNELFWDNVNGGYYTCSVDDASMILRLKEDQDGEEPTGNSVACHNLQRLAAYADESAAPDAGDTYRQMANKLLMAFSGRLNNAPTALPEMMSALMLYNDSPTQVLIVGARSAAHTLQLARAVRSRLLPGRVLAVADPAAESPVSVADILLNRISSVDGVSRAYVCRHAACSLPLTNVKQLENLLDEVPAAPFAQNK